MSLEFIKNITHLPQKVQEKIRLKIRKRAIENAKITIILAQKDINTFSEEDLEIIIADEERKVIDKIKSMSVMGLLAFFGITLF
jgi:hypothetical protein